MIEIRATLSPNATGAFLLLLTAVRAFAHESDSERRLVTMACARLFEWEFALKIEAIDARLQKGRPS